MVQRDQWDTYWGPKNIFIKFAPTIPPWFKAAAPVESCQSLPQRSPWGRLGSGLYMVSRLHRMRRRIQHILANSLSIATHLSMNYLAMASRALGGPQLRRMRCRRLHVYSTDPRRPRETSRSRSAPEKSVQFGPDGAPFPSKTLHTSHNTVVAKRVRGGQVLQTV